MSIDYRYWCTTEGKNIWETRTVEDSEPTSCVNNAGHTVDWNSLTIIKKDITNVDIGLDFVQNIKNNFVATSAPTSTDDANSDYSVGSRWVDTNSGIVYTCTDNTASSAVWTANPDPSYLMDTNTKIVKSSDSSIYLGFSLGGSTSTYTTLVTSQTSNRTITLPNATTTLIGTGTTDSLSNKTLISPVISTIINTGTLTLPTATTTLVGRTTTDTLTNKTLTTPTISSILNGGTLTLPSSTDTLVARSTTDTLSNKTLITPVISTIINTGTLTLPTSTDTLVGRTTTDTLTNKTITGSSNTVEAHRLATTSSAVVISSASAPTVGQVLTAVNATSANWQTPSTGSVSRRFDAYYQTATETTVTSSWTDIPLHVNRWMDSDFSHTAGSAEVTINTTDVYRVTCGVSTASTTGTRTISQLQVCLDTGSGYDPIPGTIGYMYNRTTNVGYNTTNASFIMQLNAGDKLKIQALVLTGSNVKVPTEGANMTINRA